MKVAVAASGFGRLINLDRLMKYFYPMFVFVADIHSPPDCHNSHEFQVQLSASPAAKSSHAKSSAVHMQACSMYVGAGNAAGCQLKRNPVSAPSMPLSLLLSLLTAGSAAGDDSCSPIESLTARRFFSQQ